MKPALAAVNLGCVPKLLSARNCGSQRFNAYDCPRQLLLHLESAIRAGQRPVTVLPNDRGSSSRSAIHAGHVQAAANGSWRRRYAVPGSDLLQRFLGAGETDWLQSSPHFASRHVAPSCQCPEATRDT